MLTTFLRTALCASITTWIAASGQPSQSLSVPEYFGFYVRDAGKMVAVGEGKTDTPPTLRQLGVAVLGSQQPVLRSAVEVSGAARFVLFYASPSDAARSFSVFRLPFVQSEITVPEMGFMPGSPPPSARARNLPGVMRLPSSQIRLLQKPVPAQPQMIELVPDPQLSAGIYGVLFAPGSSGPFGGLAGGQAAGWTALLIVGETADAVRAGECINLVQTGGLAGMIGIDSPDRGSIPGFPLLDRNHAQPCAGPSSAPAVPSPPVGPGRTSPASGRGISANQGSLALLGSAIDRDQEVVFKVRYTDSSWTRDLAQQDGVLTVSKKLVTFQPTVGSSPFSVPPQKIVELINEPDRAMRIKLKVAIPNKKGDKEDKKSYELYHPATVINGITISCARCDDSMTRLFQILEKVRKQ